MIATKEQTKTDEWEPKAASPLTIVLDAIDISYKEMAEITEMISSFGVWPFFTPFRITNKEVIGGEEECIPSDKNIYRIIGSAIPSPEVTWLTASDVIAKTFFDLTKSWDSPRVLLISINDGKLEIQLAYGNVEKTILNYVDYGTK